MGARIGVAVLLAAVLVLGPATTGEAQSSECTPRASPTYVARVTKALRSGHDVWGEELVAARGGPTYTSAARRLAPLLYARAPGGQMLTSSGVHYLPFSVPPGSSGAAGAMLHVADGSTIVARRARGRSIAVSVGPTGRERFGSCLARLTRSRLAGGWQPILQSSYRDARGGRYTQESFAARTGGTLASFVRLTGRPATAARLRIGPLSIAVARGRARTLYARWVPPARPTVTDAGTYAAARASLVAYWRGRLTEGAGIDVPEPRVMDARRALLAQGLVLTWRYSLGNPYEQFSFPETIDVARTLAENGFDTVARDVLVAALPARPTPYPNWKKGSKLLGLGEYYELTRDRVTLEQVTPTLQGFLSDLERQIQPNGLLPRERFSSDIPDPVYGLHAQATVWQGLRAIAGAWSEAGRRELAARARRLAARLGTGLRHAIRRSQRRLDDGSLFVPMRLLDGERPYDLVTESRAGSYWNLVAPYAFASGILAPRDADGVLRYLDRHGSRLLGLVRTSAYVLYGTNAGVARSGVNPVYGSSASRFLADLDRPDRLTLALYGQLTTGMTRNTFVSGEGTSIAPLGSSYRRTAYLPPNAAAGATFLETLRLMLVNESADRLELAFATPRAWLASGRRIAVSAVPTRFGPVSYSVEARASVLRVRVQVPPRPPARLSLRLRLPAGERIGQLTPKRPVERRTQTVDLSGLHGTVELVVRRER